MLRILLDTNIYGQLIKDPNRSLIISCLKRKVITYGFSIIRKELRDIPKSSIKSKRSRALLLNLYDKVTVRSFQFSKEIELLAQEYHAEYKFLGGFHSWKKMENDFLIYACASLNSLNIVASDDKKTLGNSITMKVYTDVNKKINLSNPKIITYESLLDLIMSSSR